jgi:predicted MFS family arabinose efflux permease
MRAAWGQLALDGDRTAAYSLVFLTQELAIVVGPLGVGVLVALTSASLALATVALVTGVGTFALSILLRRATNAVLNGPHVTVLRSSAMWSLLAVTALVGAAFGGLNIGVPTFATAHGTPGVSGVLVAGLSVGGVAGALIYGAVSWRTHPANRYFALLASLAVALALLPGIESLPLLAVTLVVAGLAFNPVITTTSLLVDEHVQAAAEGFGWLSTALGIGTAAGSAISGMVAEKGGARYAFLVAAVSAFAAALLGALTRKRLQVP